MVLLAIVDFANNHKIINRCNGDIPILYIYMIYLAEQNEKVLKKNYKKCEKENQEKNKKKWESKEVAFEKKN